MSELEIYPTVGFAHINLGMTREAVRSLLGPPGKITHESYPDGSRDEVWTYSNLSCDLTFGSDDSDLLGTITVSHTEATIRGARLIGLQEPVFLHELERAGIDDVVLEDDFDCVDARDYHSTSHNLSFWVSFGALEKITVMPLYDPSGNIPQWPSAAG